MIKNVTEYLDRAVQQYPDKVAFADKESNMTYKELQNAAWHTAMGLIGEGIFKKPVAVYLEKSVQCIAAFMGAVYAGNFYSPLDTEMPLPRVEKIISSLQPAVIITDEAHREAAESLGAGSRILIYEKLQCLEVDEARIKKTAERVVDTDILYVLYRNAQRGHNPA